MHKTALFEYCQKKGGLPVTPVFLSTSHGPDHRPLWQTTIKIFDETIHEGKVTFSKKKDSENHASLMALKYLRKQRDVIESSTSLILSADPAIGKYNQNLVNYPNQPGNQELPFSLRFLPEANHQNQSVIVTQKTAILVDVENLPRFISDLPKFNGFLVIYAFVGMHHPRANTNFGDGVVKIISPSTRPDGTDTCMQMRVGLFLGSELFDRYLIATRDHFGSALAELIESSGFPWNRKSAAVVSSVEHVLKALS